MTFEPGDIVDHRAGGEFIGAVVVGPGIAEGYTLVKHRYYGDNVVSWLTANLILREKAETPEDFINDIGD